MPKGYPTMHRECEDHIRAESESRKRRKRDSERLTRCIPTGEGCGVTAMGPFCGPVRGGAQTHPLSSPFSQSTPRSRPSLGYLTGYGTERLAALRGRARALRVARLCGRRSSGPPAPRFQRCDRTAGNGARNSLWTRPSSRVTAGSQGQTTQLFAWGLPLMWG
ncbi:hypothetical protein SKAU_G00300770 [Synaphobranchus kaupii]|uniref:Uncharacterized protein n=1 Tax=Synaphobranchus kaupii TaxID=118154 RepID=A0A9Q1IN05_SYNKA|nr:hypothetical protein SKAU_G00300770 [Synaphobranchus kaupii]